MKLFWKIYLGLFTFIVINSVIQLLNKNSVIGVYYNTTIVFNKWHIIPYFLNILNALINCIVCLYLFGYAFEIKNLARAPVWLFYVRLLLDCTGQTYGLKLLQSGFAQDNFYGLLGVASLVFPILPSYLAQWRMTFKHK